MRTLSSAEEMSWAEDGKHRVREREDDDSNVAARENVFFVSCGAELTSLAAWQSAMKHLSIGNNLPLLFSS